MSLSKHEITCPKLPEFKWDDLTAVQKAFANAPAIATQQAWLPQPEADFTSGTIRVGWREETLYVFAELTDKDIFTRATRNNERLWELGDVFEIFLRPDTQSAYTELHVAPNNIRLQLRFPYADALKQKKPEDFLIEPQIFESAAWIKPEANRWYAFAKIPAASICDQKVPMQGTKWHFSFSRYDYTHGRERPVISSTSPHVEARFHRQQEWGTLQFAP